jgi:molybdopterin/thiamine biosynthesis adenylyltransferase
MSETTQRNERYLRQMDFADPAKFKLPVSILGLGAAGSVIAIGVAKMGVPQLNLVDFDFFETHNVANQFCLESQHLGQNKAEAIADLALKMSALTTPQVTPFPYKLSGHEFWCPKMGFVSINPAPKNIFKGIVISCPDDMEARKDLWNLCKYNPAVPYLIDVRMAAQYLVIYIINTMRSKDIRTYEPTLHTNDQASPEPCGARGIIYTSMMVGAQVTNLVKKIQLGEKVPEEIRQDLLTGELTIVHDGKIISNREELVLALV